MLCDAKMIAFIPDAHTLLMVVASVESGILAPRTHQFPGLFIRLIIDPPRANPDLPRGTLSDAGLYDIPHVDLLHATGLDTGFTHRMLDGGDTELGCGEGRETAIDGPHGRSGGRDDVDGLRRLRLELRLRSLGRTA